MGGGNLEVYAYDPYGAQGTEVAGAAWRSRGNGRSRDVHAVVGAGGGGEYCFYVYGVVDLVGQALAQNGQG